MVPTTGDSSSARTRFVDLRREDVGDTPLDDRKMLDHVGDRPPFGARLLPSARAWDALDRAPQALVLGVEIRYQL
jgi:hypothetical protein